MSSRNRHRPAPAKHPTSNQALPAPLKRLADAQARLNKAEEAAGHAAAARRHAVKEAFAAGMDTRELATLLKVSRAMIYRLIAS